MNASKYEMISFMVGGLDMRASITAADSFEE
jgi:hypothetical protein